MDVTYRRGRSASDLEHLLARILSSRPHDPHAATRVDLTHVFEVQFPQGLRYNRTP